MRLLRTVLAWGLGLGLFGFMVLCLIVVPWFGPPRSWDPLAKRLSRLLVACFGMRVTLLPYLEEGWPEGAIIVSNHVSLLDGFLLYGALPLFFRGLEQREHFSWPVWGWFTRRFGNIPLHQGGGGGTSAGLRAASRALGEGCSVLVYPEGHRTRDGEFLPFHRGAFRLAERTGAPLLPVVVAGSWEVQHKGKGRVDPGPVEVIVLPPWTAERRKGLDEEAFRGAVRAEMVAAYAEGRARLIRSIRGPRRSRPGDGASAT